MRPHWVKEHYRENAPYVRGYIRGCGSDLAAKRSYFNNAESGEEYRERWSSARASMPARDRWRCALSDENAAKCDELDGIFHVTSGGSCIAVASDGTVIAHAPNADDTMSVREHLTLAVECGGKRIDGYAGMFEDYRLAGFVPVAYVEWDPAFAADGWEPEYGGEHIIFYVHESMFSELDDDVDDIDQWISNHVPAATYEEAEAQSRAICNRLEKRIEFNNTPDARTYINNLAEAKESVVKKNAWRVYKPSSKEFLEEHPGALLYTSPGGSCAAVCADGEIVGVCHKEGDDMRGKELLAKAVEVGGTKLDSYDGNHIFYTKCGFAPVSWCRWDERLAPDDWNPAFGAESVIFYAYAEYLNDDSGVSMSLEDWKATHPPCKDYETAMRARDKALEQAARVR